MMDIHPDEVDIVIVIQIFWGKCTHFTIRSPNPFLLFYKYRLIGALPLMKCRFSHSLLQLHRILGGMGGGGLTKGVNTPQAMESQRCKSSASRVSVNEIPTFDILRGYVI